MGTGRLLRLIEYADVANCEVAGSEDPHGPERVDVRVNSLSHRLRPRLIKVLSPRMRCPSVRSASVHCASEAGVFSSVSTRTRHSRPSQTHDTADSEEIQKIRETHR